MLQYHTTSIVSTGAGGFSTLPPFYPRCPKDTKVQVGERLGWHHVETPHIDGIACRAVGGTDNAPPSPDNLQSSHDCPPRTTGGVT